MTSRHVESGMSNNEALALAGVEDGIIAYSLRVRLPDETFAQLLPGIMIGGLAVEIAERLREDFPGARVGFIRYGLGAENRAEVEALTERVKAAAIDARTREFEGLGLLEALEFWIPPKPENAN